MCCCGIVTNGAEGSGSGVRQQRELHDFAETHAIERWYVLERKARLAGQSPAFVGAHTKAAENERSNRPAKALAWYLNALAESPGNEPLTDKVQSLGNQLLNP